MSTMHARKALLRMTAGVVALDPTDSEILRLLREGWADLVIRARTSARA